MVSTAAETAKSGYVFRKLVTFLKDVVTGYNKELRCGGTFLTELYNYNGLDIRF